MLVALKKHPPSFATVDDFSFKMELTEFITRHPLTPGITMCK